MVIRAETREAIVKSSITVRKGRYAYAILPEPLRDGRYVFCGYDADSVVAILGEDDVSGSGYTEIERWFTLVEIHTRVPYMTNGFLAAITDALSRIDTPIFSVVTGVKIYILVSQSDALRAVGFLRDIGFSLVKSD